MTKFLVEEWDAVPQSTVNNLVMFMKTRCEIVLEKTAIEYHIEIFLSNKGIDQLLNKFKFIQIG
ncbi:17814_t:CDS:1 [Funneliformis caledonium]|uniref:17814_t:CDS:1 n=1 Tax=Funneliformis caledonium TaxID=1117310 RepID=A0A9N9ITY8_9GLOM|nr:17814_t:CDS:1 [Funneliformis caledonium]